MNVTFTSKLSVKKDILAIICDKKSLASFEGLSKGVLNKVINIAKYENFKFNKLESLEIIGEEKSGYSKIIVIGSGESSSLSLSDQDLIGGKILQLGSGSLGGDIDVLVSKNIDNDNGIERIGYGAILGSYRFDKYKSKKKKISLPKNIKIVSKNFKLLTKKLNQKKSVAEGVFLARDLVNEPSNILNPESYAKRIKDLSKYGLKVEVLNETKMKKLAFHKESFKKTKNLDTVS